MEFEVLHVHKKAKQKRQSKSDVEILMESLEANTNYTPKQRRKILALYEEFHANLDKIEKEN